MFAFDPEVKIGKDTFETVRDDGSKLDLLDRAAFGKRLSDLMEGDSQPLVVALDGAWGSGKSHFLKLWVGTHNQDAEHKARVVYFDTFARDYLDDPLISLVAAIARAQDDGEGRASAKTVHNLKSVAVKLAKPAIRIGLAAVTAGVSEGVVAAWDEVFDKSVEAMSDEAKAALDKLWQREEGRIAAVEGFHKALEELATEQPLILVIDELDRCRPDYALSLLEVVKHFFAVKGVRFVLGVNLEALEHSVRQRYGAGVDAGLYLQKFVHLKLALPRPQDEQAWESYFQALIERLDIQGRGSDYARNTVLLFRKRPVSLRDVERIVTRLALLPKDFANYYGGYQFSLFTAIALETLAPASYTKLRNSTIGFAEIDDLFGLNVAAQNGSHFAEHMSHIWSRILLDEPSQETLRATEGAFDRIFGRKPRIEPILRDILDTFAPPPAR